jgi:hypothetical protein
MRNSSGLDDLALDRLTESTDVGVRYLAARDLAETGQKKLNMLKSQAHADGPISTILSKLKPQGFWVKPGAGYYPKYTGTTWSLILLAQLGASADADIRISTACTYALDHTLLAGGQFTINGLPSGTVDCLQGNLCATMLDLGCADQRLDSAFEWMARSVTGEGVAPREEKHASVRYYAGKCGPCFACGANNSLPCAWGAVKVMSAFSKIPPARRTKLVDRAIRVGVDFLLGTDPAKSDYPCGWAAKPSSNWWKFGFPVFYITDLLQNVEALAGLGLGKDKRLKNALEFIRSKRDSDGAWALEHDYTGKTWVDFGKKKQPNPWVTIRALRALKAATA